MRREITTLPTYIYGCNSCKIAIEKSHGMSDRPRYACPQCGGILTGLPGKKGIQFLKRTEELLNEATSDGHTHTTDGSCCWHRVDEILSRNTKKETDDQPH